MSSVLLYLAIVVMWLCVLVPMWLRRDRTTLAEIHESAEPYVQMEDEPLQEEAGTASAPPPPQMSPSSPTQAFSMGSGSRTPSRVSTPMSGQSSPTPASGRSPEGSGPEPPPRRPRPDRHRAERRRAERRRRSRRVAKRRRLTLCSVLLLLASAVTAAIQVIPWWGVTPSAFLLGLYLAVLRVSAQIDAEHHRAAVRARKERVRRARRRAELEARRPVAEIIDLDAHRDELFDQYAEPPRRAVGN
ncbi:divisome protein SepX/GlpR [Streptosporangium sp. NPDC004631]